MSKPKLEHQITIGRLRANLSVTRGIAEPKHACVTLERRHDDASELFYPAATFRSADLDGLIQLLVEMRHYLTHPDPASSSRPKPDAAETSNQTGTSPPGPNASPSPAPRAAGPASAAPKPSASPAPTSPGRKLATLNGQGRHAAARPKQTRPVVPARTRSR